MHMRLTRRAALSIAGTALLAPSSWAQFRGQTLGRGPLLGVWSSGTDNPQRPAPGQVGITFRIDGLYQKRTGVATSSLGYVEVIGTWRWDEKASELTWQPEEYNPKDGPPPEPLGKSSKVAVQIVDKDNVVLQVPGGPLRLKKLF